MNMSDYQQRIEELRSQEEQMRLGGGSKAIDRQHAKSRLTARERIDQLIDPDTDFFEIGLWAAFGMYEEWGGAPSAGVVTGIGTIAGQQHMIVANDATVKAGAFFPATAKKVLRAQRIAMENRLPLCYLVDSAGVFLPLQDEVFPDQDDFGRIFRNNAVISAAGIPQLAAIMGNCVAGGGYLPVLCDKILMTDGSGLYLAGPALVKSAIGEQVSSDDLGGAEMHAEISGTIDFREPDDPACLQRIRRLTALRAADPAEPCHPFMRGPSVEPAEPAERIPSLIPERPTDEFDVRDLLNCLVDADSFDEFKRDYGKSLVCGTARIDGYTVGIVANQHQRVTSGTGEFQFGGVLYVDSAEKAARFVMDCNQQWLPILFFQDVNGFMVGQRSERSGIIKAGAKMVNAMSNSRVPKITVITGGSFGAGNYALCGKAFDPRFIFAWPQARCAVMGAGQATSTLLDVTVRSMQRTGKELDAEELAALRDKISSSYEEQTDIRYAAARGWVDRIIHPENTRQELSRALRVVTRSVAEIPFQLGVFQV